MKMPNWLAIVFLGVILLAILVVAGQFGGGWGWGMMGPGMMGWGFDPLAWIVLPLLLGAIALVLLLGLTWSIRALRGTKPKYCPSCGCEALTDARFCSNCGKPLPK